MNNSQFCSFQTLKKIYDFLNTNVNSINKSSSWADLSSEKEGFYLSHQNRNGKHTAVLAVMIDTDRTSGSSSSSKKKSDKSPSKKEIMFQIYRPNTGLQFRHESLAEIEKKYKKVQSDEAEPHWNQQYDSSVQTCSHAYWRGNCRNVSSGVECEV